jgi:hypothetical protein
MQLKDLSCAEILTVLMYSSFVTTWSLTLRCAEGRALRLLVQSSAQVMAFIPETIFHSFGQSHADGRVHFVEQ